MPAKYLWRSSLTQSQWSICTANGPIMTFIYKGKAMDLQEMLFCLIRSFHNCFLTENMEKTTTTTKISSPNQQHKTPLFFWITFPWIKNIFRQIEVKKIFLSSPIFLLERRGRISKHETDHKTCVHLLTKRELRKHLNLRNFWNCFTVHIVKCLCYHTIKTQ